MGKSFLLGWKNVLELSQGPGSITKCHWIVHYKGANFMLYEYYLNMYIFLISAEGCF